MSKVRVYEVAKQLNLDPKAVVSLFQTIGVADVRNHMSSVESDQVERVKRHLEKQRTHDVVEERIRPTVVKRRAVAKPADSAAAIPDAPESLRAVPAPPPSRASVQAVPPAPVSSASLKPSAAASASPALPAAPPSSRVEAPMSSSSPVGGDLAAAAPSAARLPDDRESGRLRSGRAERSSASDLPAAAPSQRALGSEGPSGATLARSAAPTDDVAPRAPALDVQSQAALSGDGQDGGAVLSVSHADDTVPVSEGAPTSMAAAMAAEDVVPAPGSEPMRIAAVSVRDRAPSAPHGASTEAPAPSSGAARPSSAPKTGVEYWTGRPGVPMQVPTTPRTGMSGALPRRVQYDPRTGMTSGTGGIQRRDVRGPGQQPPRGPMGSRGGAGGMRRPGQGGPTLPRRPVQVSTQEMSAHKKVIRIEENITLQAMAAKMSLKSTELLMKLLSMGMTGVHINTTLDADTAKILASDFGWEVEDVAQSDEESLAAARGEEVASVREAGVEPRAPVVTVMGHVDHGKTSLLDRIRKANVASGEAGGITQHIGAYKVTTPSGPIVFLDTPGHEAFTAMRARGASVTDLVVLVVAADDGVMQQTREAVSHAKTAKVPIIVAVNKVDKPSAEPERVRRELVELGLQPEEWGGDTIFVDVSAHSGVGIDQLLEMIHLQSEVLELRANAKKAASGTVLEALLDRGRGPVARVLVQDGTLRVGDFVLAGPGFGKVRAMTNEHGKQVHEAGPSTPVEILGLSDVPGAGDPLDAVKDAKKAQEIADQRRGRMAKSLIPASAKVSLEELSKRMAESGQLELRVIVKGDVQGSVEALSDALQKLGTSRVRLTVIHAGVGAITEGDVNLAIAARAIIIGFNARPAGKSAALAEENKIEIRQYSIIYNALEDVRGAMEGLLPPTLVEKQIGKAEVRALFKLKVGVVAGCYVTEGVVKRSGKARLLRGGEVIFDGKIAALKRFKDDVKDVAEGFECGITLEGHTDIKEGDVIASYEIEEIKQKL